MKTSLAVAVTLMVCCVLGMPPIPCYDEYRSVIEKTAAVVTAASHSKNATAVRNAFAKDIKIGYTVANADSEAKDYTYEGLRDDMPEEFMLFHLEGTLEPDVTTLTPGCLKAYEAPKGDGCKTCFTFEGKLHWMSVQRARYFFRHVGVTMLFQENEWKVLRLICKRHADFEESVDHDHEH